VVEADLFRPDADVDGRAAVDRVGRRADHRAVCELDDPETVRGSLALATEQVADTQERGREPGGRVLVERLRVAQLLVPAGVHDGDPVGHRHRHLLVVGHVDERDPDLLLDALELDLHLLAQLEIERAQRLVEEEDGGPVDERARQGDALRLPARDLGRLSVLEAGQLHELEHVGDARLDLRVLHLRPPEAERDVLEDREVREQRVVLEHGVHVALVRRQPGHVLALELDPAGRRLLEPADHPERRRLAAARRPEQAEELPVHHFEIDVIHGVHIAERLRYLDEPDVDSMHG
jgi:hypothetical protein